MAAVAAAAVVGAVAAAVRVKEIGVTVVVVVVVVRAEVAAEVVLVGMRGESTGMVAGNLGVCGLICLNIKFAK